MPVLLREVRPSDDEVLRSLLEDPEVRRWNPMDPADPQAWRAAVTDPGDRAVTFVVADPVDDRALGTVALFSLDHAQGTAEIGYRVAPAERGRGVAGEAVAAAAEHGFGRLGLRRVQLFHAVANSASCGAAGRAGFLLEGTLRESWRYGDGTAYDEHVHARLATDPPPAPPG